MIIIGGGDTGADCLGTAHRQGAASVHQFDIHEQPPDERHESTPWLLAARAAGSLAHEEGGKRVFVVQTDSFVGDEGGRVRVLPGGAPGTRAREAQLRRCPRQRLRAGSRPLCRWRSAFVARTASSPTSWAQK